MHVVFIKVSVYTERLVVKTGVHIDSQKTTDINDVTIFSGVNE